MKKLCIIYNFAQKYREAIFTEIDRTWDCTWFFGRNTTDIKGMDLSKLKNVTEVDNIDLFGPLGRQKGVADAERHIDSDTLLMLGEPFNLTSWHILLRNRFRSKSRRRRILVWTHGWYGREGFLKKWLKRVYFSMADHVFTYGEYARRQAIAQGFDGSKISPIHNSLDFDNQKQLRDKITDTDVYKRHFGNDHPTLLFVGRLTKVKRLDQLIEAVALLDKEGQSVNLTLIGDGSETKALRQLVKARGLEDKVWFYGACYDDSQNATLIYNADLCVAPGNVGLTAMHSMAFGTPVLTHNNFPMQMPEFEAIVEGKTGAFFDYGSVTSLASCIIEWLTKRSAEREAVRQACYDEIESRWSVPYQMNVLKKIIE